MALVLGGSRGLGLLVAHELADRGHDLVICSRSEENLTSARAHLMARHPDRRVVTVACDASDEASVRDAVTTAERELGPLDVAVHVAGIIEVGPWEATTEEHLRRAIDVMLWGPIHLALAATPGMRERGHGRFGVVTSVGGVVSPPRLLAYSTAKSGALGFTEALSAELAGTGVTVTAIVPGLMRTGSHTEAQFYGDAARQYAWFAPAASLPLVSMDARRAASQMVDGLLAGRPYVLVSPLSQVASRVHGVLPATTVRLMGLASRVLPRGNDAQPIRGAEARQRLGSRLVNRLTTLGDRAGRGTNEPDC